MTFNAGDYLIDHLGASVDVVEKMLKSDAIRQTILDIAQRLTRTFKAGNKLLICGNGGSCADAQHIAAEFVGRYQKKRPSLPAFAIGDSAGMSAIANDYSYEHVFSMPVQALKKPGDALLVITTSGRSVNIFAALELINDTASIVFTGSHGADIPVDHLLVIPSTSTPIIQQGYMAAAHAICGIVEQEMFG